MRVIDSHAHLTHGSFEADLEDVLARAAAAGVQGVVSIASDLDEAERAGRLARATPGVWSTVGVHPHAAEGTEPDALDVVRDLAASPHVVAIGETGLDYHYDFAPRERQRDLFARHLELAGELGMPVVVHSRSADEDTRAMIEAAGEGTRGVLHCFAGGAELLDCALSRGWFVSFTGLVTFSSWNGADLLRSVPGDRLMVETDSPYMAPVPHRGKRCEPAFVVEVLRAVARLREDDEEALMERCLQNTREFFSLPEATLSGSTEPHA